jgi:hypothetical protein
MPVPYQLSDKDIYENGVVAHSSVIAAGMFIMFRAWQEASPVIFVAGAAATVAGAYGFRNNRQDYERRTILRNRNPA